MLWDAITDFDVYGTSFQSRGSTSAALSHLAGVYNGALQSLAPTNVAFIPTASPGFNDSGVRSGHPAAPRYMTDDPNSKEGDLFARMLNEVVVPRTDPKADDILMINSFNEWHEDTQIEPTIAAPRTNIDDSGTQRYTEGHFYEGYGDLYLDILQAATKPTVAGDYNRNGTVDAADYVVWRDSLAGVDTAFPPMAIETCLSTPPITTFGKHDSASPAISLPLHSRACARGSPRASRRCNACDRPDIGVCLPAKLLLTAGFLRPRQQPACKLFSRFFVEFSRWLG